MRAGDPGGALIGAMDRLCAELQAPNPDGIAAAAPGRFAEGVISGEDELLVRRLRTSLARIAAAVGMPEPAFEHPLIPQMTLDGAEMMMRGEILKGNRERLAQLLPDFVFLVALPGAHQDRALELSRRTAELIQAALED